MLWEETFLRYRRLVVVTLFLWATNFWFYKGGLAEAASPVVTDIRIGTIGDVTRAVFEFTQRMNVKRSTLKNPYRVVLDMPEVGWRLPATPLPTASGIFGGLPGADASPQDVGFSGPQDIGGPSTRPTPPTPALPDPTTTFSSDTRVSFLFQYTFNFVSMISSSARYGNATI